jgi:hypothetical protein
MKHRFLLLTVLFSAAVMVFTSVAVPAAYAESPKVEFEPVRAPSKGPDNAPVTVYEIGDFM